MSENNTNNAVVVDPYAELVSDKAAYLFCDACGFFPIEPLHGHFVCPSCYHQTRCCEGSPADV